MKRVLEAATEYDAVELLHQSGSTDGLPVIVPTVNRVAAMIARVDLDADLSLGEIGPKLGAATIEKVAAAAVMAGCLPDHFPVVIAAIRLVCRNEFDITEVNQTTHCLAPLILVNGPARTECGPINSGAGILGPGNRASASIGRALSLVLINIGGRQSGVTDMAVFSTPGKFTACLAEAEELSPFDSYHQSIGFHKEESVVTIIGVEAPHSLILEPIGDVEKDALRLLQCIAAVIANPASNHVYRAGEGGMVVVLNPEHAMILHKAGYNRKSVQLAIQSYAYISREYADSLFSGLNFVHKDDTDKLYAVRDAEQIMLVVAGGMGSYSMVLPSWAYAPHGNQPLSKKFDVYPYCDTPIKPIS
ncbi:MAG: hypothetical protein ACI8P9_000961 [Parasphingorhabdus sp.]